MSLLDLHLRYNEGSRPHPELVHSSSHDESSDLGTCRYAFAALDRMAATHTRGPFFLFDGDLE